jgi:sugar lactone lactonase YvrE
VNGERKIVAYDAEGKMTVIAEGFAGNDIVVASNGNIFVTNPPPGASNDPSKIWLIKPNGEKREVDTGLRYSNGLTLSPDQTLLYVADMRSHWVYSYQIQPDGSLQFKQRYYWLHILDTADDSGADGMRVDRDGRLYVATRMGVQVCDQAGRVNAIIPTPNGRVSNLTFGGANGDTLFATCGDKVYKRKLKVKGAHAWDKPLKPAPPRL